MIRRLHDLMLVWTRPIALTIISSVVWLKPASALPSFDEAVAAYNNKQYGQALTILQAISKANPQVDMAHYYMALCYQRMNQMSQAKSQYDWVAEHSSNPTLKDNARTGARSLARYVRAGAGSTNTSKSPSPSDTLGSISPNSFFLTQVSDPKWNRNGPRNSLDCGPTCLAMVLRRFNKFPPQISSGDSSRLIQSTRYLMTGSYESTTTTSQQISDAAKRVSLNTAFINQLDEIETALSEGKLVIALGCPFQQSSYGNRVGYRPFNNGHFILLTSKAQGQFVANDPYYLQGPVSLSSGELESFLTFFPRSKKRCIAIWP